METVLYCDVESGRIVHMPAAELRPGCVQVRLEGVDGLVWIAAEHLSESPVRHPPFGEPFRSHIQTIQETFAEHCGMPFEEWEEGFRRDADPDKEIAVWMHAAEVYDEFAKTTFHTVDEREDVYKTLVTCLSSSPTTVWNVLELSSLSRAEAAAVVERFFDRPIEGGLHNAHVE
ncbi:MAG: hypothetical protein ACRDD1_00090 [Planctomycetia bacterium]